jgi:hypothetical protein
MIRGQFARKNPGDIGKRQMIIMAYRIALVKTGFRSASNAAGPDTLRVGIIGPFLGPNAA